MGVTGHHCYISGILLYIYPKNLQELKNICTNVNDPKGWGPTLPIVKKMQHHEKNDAFSRAKKKQFQMKYEDHFFLSKTFFLTHPKMSNYKVFLSLIETESQSFLGFLVHIFCFLGNFLVSHTFIIVGFVLDISIIRELPHTCIFSHWLFLSIEVKKKACFSGHTKMGLWHV